ncbi:MAG: TlyA family RNA methyltransferase [Ruminococcaceae bacterium]|nr:TlyA family RNA methyltransferase [Oscillospiraceae bacterium]
MRLDAFLAERSLCDSRTDAKNFILSGAVTVNGKIIKKPSHDISGEEDITVDKSGKKYVGRGGLKLEAALSFFDVSVDGKLAIDIGASSGGFTDCLLQNGAAHVIAVDSGSGQLAEALRCDSRVTVIENYNARYMNREDFEYLPTLAVMDVSFISATLIMPSLKSSLAPSADFICLIKPQFEVGRRGLGKGGIVKNAEIRNRAVNEVIDFAKALGFVLIDVKQSPIVGGDGNIEYLAHFKNSEA